MTDTTYVFSATPQRMALAKRAHAPFWAIMILVTAILVVSFVFIPEIVRTRGGSILFYVILWGLGFLGVFSVCARFTAVAITAWRMLGPVLNDGSREMIRIDDDGIAWRAGRLRWENITGIYAASEAESQRVKAQGRNGVLLGTLIDVGLPVAAIVVVANPGGVKRAHYIKVGSWLDNTTVGAILRAAQRHQNCAAPVSWIPLMSQLKYIRRHPGVQVGTGVPPLL